MSLVLRVFLSFFILTTVAFATDDFDSFISLESLPPGSWETRSNASESLKKLGLKRIAVHSYQSGFAVLRAVNLNGETKVFSFGQIADYEVVATSTYFGLYDVKAKYVLNGAIKLLYQQQVFPLYRAKNDLRKAHNLVGTWKYSDAEREYYLSVNEDLSFYTQSIVDGSFKGRITLDEGGFFAKANDFGDRLILPVFQDERDSIELFVDSFEMIKFHKLSETPLSRFLIDGNGNLVTIDHLSIDVEINQALAVTTLDLRFTNPNPDSSEVAFELPLPSDAIVTNYSLEINGKMIPSSAVPKALARQAFEEIEMLGVDPGLAEVTENNQFRTEIFPVEQGEQRRISLTYTQPLEGDSRARAQYRFPLSKLGSIESLDVRVQVDTESRPKQRGLTKQAQFIRSRSDLRSRFVLNFSESSYEPGSDLLLDIKLKNKTSVVNSNLMQASDGRYYFALWGRSSNNSRVNLKKERVVLVWDVSLSMEQYHADYLSLLGRYLDKSKGVELKIVLFSTDLKTIEVDEEGVEKVFSNVSYDGATDFSLLRPVLSESADYFMFFTDGLSTYTNFDQLTPSAPVYTISPYEASVNRPFIRSISSIGNHFELNQKNSKKIVKSIGERVSVPRVHSSSGLADIEVVRSFGFNSRFYITGKVENFDNAYINYSIDGRESTTIELQKKTGEKSDSAKILWLQSRLQKLLAYPSVNRDTIEQLGLRHRFPTPFTSLIVLEEVDDYVRYGIDPPEILLSKSEYNRLRCDYLKLEQEELESRHKQLLESWRQRLEWWKEPLKFNNKRASRRPRGSMDSFSGGDEFEEIVVTGAKKTNNNGKTISIEPWQPDAPYIKAISNASRDKWYSIYLEQRVSFKGQPAFYLDVAKLFFINDLPGEGVKILSNLLEMHPENVSLQRMVAYTLFESKRLNEAIRLLKMIEIAYPFQATSKRDLARVWESLAEQSGQREHFQNAIDYYYSAAVESGDFPEGLPIVSLTEMNRLLPIAMSKGVSVEKIDSEFIASQNYDIRVTLSWSNNMADVDLRVVEPSGDIVYYSNPNSEIGGRLPFDNTSGFGPEVYLLKNAVPGTYRVEANYFANSSVEAFGPVTLVLTLYLDYGSENQIQKTTSVRLNSENEKVVIGHFAF